MATLPIVVTASGAQITAPATLRAQLLAIATAEAPGLTADLPGALIEDIASTDTGALVVMDAAKVDLINSVTPYGANVFLLNQLGQIYGVQKGLGSNASVSVVFSGPPGFVINRGFTVGDGTHQYIVQDGGIIGSSGQSSPLYCVCVQSGIFSIPAGTVTQLVTSVPNTISLACTNPINGIPAESAQTEEEYRAQVIQAGISSAQGFASFLKTQLEKVSGVQARLVSIQQVGSTWRIIVGGGDPYEVANAIFIGLFDIGSLIGSTLNVTNITNASPGVVTTDMAHGYSSGQIVTMTGVLGMTSVNNLPLTIAVLGPKTFSIGLDTSVLPVYAGGGVLTPNVRNVVVSINDFPDTYLIPFVTPLQQAVELFLVWNTISTNFVSPAAVAQLAIPALVDYVNSIVVGQPLNVYEMQNVFQTSVAGILPAQLISKIAFSVTINGQSVSPDPGTGLIYGDSESYFLTSNAGVFVTQG